MLLLMEIFHGLIMLPTVWFSWCPWEALFMCSAKTHFSHPCRGLHFSLNLVLLASAQFPNLLFIMSLILFLKGICYPALFWGSWKLAMDASTLHAKDWIKMSVCQSEDRIPAAPHSQPPSRSVTDERSLSLILWLAMNPMPVLSAGSDGKGH